MIPAKSTVKMRRHSATQWRLISVTGADGWTTIWEDSTDDGHTATGNQALMTSERFSHYKNIRFEVLDDFGDATTRGTKLTEADLEFFKLNHIIIGVINNGVRIGYVDDSNFTIANISGVGLKRVRGHQ